MKIFKSLRRQSFTLVELLVVISIIGILATLTFPALQRAIVQANLTKVLSNARQIQMAAQSAALDASANGLSGIGWPGDVTNATSPKDYFANLVTNGGYLPAVSDLKILSAPGIPPNGTNYPTAQNNAFSLGMVTDSDMGSAIFLFTKNLTITAGSAGGVASGAGIDAAKKPFGNNGFVIFRKGGDGGKFGQSQSTDTSGLLGTIPSGTPAFNVESQ